MENINEVVRILASGGVVLHPTDTCYGLAVDIFNRDALERLYLLKNMPLDKPVSILVNSLEMALEYGDFSDEALKIAEKYWPGALSILVPRKSSLPDFFNKGHSHVSIRYADDDFCNAMVGDLGGPVTTTSANISGEEQLYAIDHDAEIVKKVDFVVDSGEIEKKKPSTIIKLERGKIDVLRQGDILLE